jgi:hypothetical protein
MLPLKLTSGGRFRLTRPLASRSQVMHFEEAVLVWPPTERALLTRPCDLAMLREP